MGHKHCYNDITGGRRNSLYISPYEKGGLKTTGIGSVVRPDNQTRWAKLTFPRSVNTSLVLLFSFFFASWSLDDEPTLEPTYLAVTV